MKVLFRQFLNLPRPVNLLAALKVHQNALLQKFDGFAGVLFAHTSHFISTDHFDILLSIFFIVMILVGGVGSIYGAVLGTLFIVLMENLFIPLFEDGLAQIIRIESGELQVFIFGLIMLLFIIFQPQGLYGMWLKMRIYWKLFPFNPRKRFT